MSEHDVLVFLLLMPPRAHDHEVRILAQIARSAIDASARQKLLDATSLDETLGLLSASRSSSPVRSAPRASLADI
jgi:mannitol/fructose-specific phosphotransferase system IIA component (Ntr-type)